ncbi:MAG: hypothetical protein LBL19_07855 [Spirochaetaceae bacterium]|jgi:hypothetical protein|nr:hypothetical protein [Spirochaetaceae bacterium]
MHKAQQISGRGTACGILALGFLLLVTGCPTEPEPPSPVVGSGETVETIEGGGDNGKTDGGDGGKGIPEPPVPPGPALLNATVLYGNGYETGAVSFTFSMNVEVLSPDPEDAAYSITGNGTNQITVSPVEPVPGTPISVALTVEGPAGGNSTKTLGVSQELIPVSGPFTRPADARVYTVEYAAGDLVGLKGAGDSESAWYYIPAGETALRQLFNAIYRPNAPDTEDNVEAGKRALPYTAAISKTVLSLFKITLGPEASADKIELSGAALPTADSTKSADMRKFYPVVIDIGIPGEDNGGLPVVSIPPGGIGTAGEDYDYIRLRVNRGAKLVILADNGAYEAEGAGNPCPHGNLENGTVEVMGGGSLRDGAYEGSPLGAGSVIIARLGSRLATGPESSFSSAHSGFVPARDVYYEGWLIGPSGEDARILWDPGDQNGGYIEVREDRLAFDANVTLRKSLALIYSVWFVNGPTLTIDAAGDSLEIGGRKGLFARPGAYKFYGTFFRSGGQNPAKPAAKIIIKKGSAISRSFLEAGNSESDEFDEFITAENSAVTISNKGGNSSTAEYYRTGGVSGYCNWDIP